MASAPVMSDAELRRKLSDLGFNVGPITDTTRPLYTKKLSDLQATSSTDSPKKTQGQKRKAKSTPSPKAPTVETPSKRPRRGGVLPIQDLKTPPPNDTLSSGSPPVAPLRSEQAKSARRGRSRKSIVASKSVRVEEVAAQETMQNEHSAYSGLSASSLSSDGMKEVFLAAVRVLERNGTSSSNPSSEEDPQPSTSGITHSPARNSPKTRPLRETIRPYSRTASVESSGSEEEMEIINETRIPHRPFNLATSPKTVPSETCHSPVGSVERDALLKKFPEAHKFIEDAWYSPNRDRRMTALLDSHPRPNLAKWRISEIDPELVRRAASRGVDLETADGALRTAQVALQNAAGPIYSLIHACVNEKGILTKKLVKDCVRDSLTFVSYAYQILGGESERLRQQQQEFRGNAPGQDLNEIGYESRISNENMFQQRVANAMGGRYNTAGNQRSTTRSRRF